MNEYIELISQLKPKNNGSFPIADTRDLIGGYIQLDTITQLTALLNTNKVRTGMCAYVSETNKIYKYTNGTWELFNISGSGGGATIIQVNLLNDLANDDYKIPGQLVFVKEVNDLRYFDGEIWKSFTKIYIQSTPPEDSTGIWIDTSDNHTFSSENAIITELLQVISILQEKVNRLEWAFSNQMDFGDFNNNHYSEYTGHTTEEPDFGSNTDEDLDTLLENIVTEEEPVEYKDLIPNGTHLCIKSGTYAEMMANKNNFLPKELLWCYDKQQLWIKDPKTNNLIQIGSSNGTEEPSTDETMEQILTQLVGSGNNATTKIVGIEFGDMSNLENTYRLSVKNGKLDLYDYRLDKKTLAGNSQILSKNTYYTLPYFPVLSDLTGNSGSPMIYIDTVYAGGSGTSKDYNPCSHNFIVISNLTNVDLNLKGLYLHYTESTSGQWITLPLKGVIKSKGTFTIRGAQCSFMDVNTTYIKVLNYDMEWTKEQTYHPDVFKTTDPDYNIWDENGLIRFADNCSFYLSGEETDGYFQENMLNTTAPWSTDGFAHYYVDLLGIGKISNINMPAEKSPFPVKGRNILILRYYTMDFVSQAIKAATARDNSADFTYINIGQLNPKIDFTKYTPTEEKNLFYNKTLLKEGVNIITCSFGYNAHTTRCFTWVSKGYYDEYIWFADDNGNYTEVNKFESFKSGDGRTSNKNWNSPIYNRIRSITTDGTAFTTHKFIKDFPEPTTSKTYKYKVGREGFWSEERSFTLRNRNVVIENGYNVAHITDPQGFNAEEYETFRLPCEYIKNNETFDWVLHTGDATQNGNRINEWLDHFNAANVLFKDYEYMFTVGNNDLCPLDVYTLGVGDDISKVNPKNVEYFYTFEHPYAIPQTAEGIYIPSLYSFIYGNTYYLSMNSEITETARKDIFNDATGFNIYTNTIKNWCDNDLSYLDSTINWKIAFCHESPFSIITADLIYSYVKPDTQGILQRNSGIKRGGSHLNTVGNYWFSKFLEDNLFDMCLCGHKHTYAETRLLRDNPDATMEPIVYDPTYDPVNNIYPTWYNNLSDRGKMCVQLSNDNTQHYVKYVMNQATGYKLVSNKELPAKNIPWLQNYYPVSNETYDPLTNTVTVTVNSAQKNPHYIMWSIGNGNETETGTTNTRQRILGQVYKIILNGQPSVSWTYKYNVPISVNQLTKIKSNGSSNPNNNIIVEKLQ